MGTSTTKLPTPWWVWAVCIAIAAVEPITHLWIAHGLPEGVAPTGLHSGDSHMYITAMRAGTNDWYSPYAGPDANPNDPAYFNVPTHRVYAALGWVTSMLGLDTFMALGLLNGLSAFAYIFAAYRFLRAVAPQLHQLAFILFAFGGGIGGPLYIVAHILGVTTTPEFETWFGRHAAYDLIEGAHLWPLLHAPRLYYTLAMACMLTAMTMMTRAKPPPWRIAIAMVLVLIAQIINMRAGTFFWAMGAVYFLMSHWPLRIRIGIVGALFVPIAIGAIITLWAISNHPSYTANVYEDIGETMLFSALLSAILLHIIIAAPEFLRNTIDMRGIFRYALFAIIGYLSAWILLYAGYQLYYGNLFLWGDVTSAIVISDWALIGAPIGITTAHFVPSREDDGRLDDVRWAVLWLGIAIAVGISAWGQGAFMALLPRRLLVAMALPLCLVTASAITRMGAVSGLRAKIALATLLICGLSTTAVGALIFQGPLGHTPGQGPFARIHYEAMSEHDAKLLDTLGEGRVLTPMFNPYTFGDVIALRGNPVVCAVGTLNHSDRPFSETKDAVNAFFDNDTSTDQRADFVRQERVAYVYCPDTCPVDEDVITALEAMEELTLVDRAGRGALFRVTRESDLP